MLMHCANVKGAHLGLSLNAFGNGPGQIILLLAYILKMDGGKVEFARCFL